MGNVTEFFKLLVEWGDVYGIDDDDTIVTKDDNQPVLIDINGNQLPLKVFSNNMMVGKHTFFNPLVETLGHSKERSWFFTTRSMILGVMIKKLMIRAVELAITTDEDIDYDKLELIQPFMAKADEKLITEIQSLRPNKILRIFYNKKQRTAQLQTELYDKKFQDTYKFRKKSWEVILGMLESFMGTDDVHETYKFKGTTIGLQETHAMLNVMLMATQSIHEYAKLLIDVDLHYPEFSMHMENLEQYRKACAWAATGTIQHDKMATKPSDDNVWKAGGPIANPVPQVINPMAPVQAVVEDDNVWTPQKNSSAYGSPMINMQPNLPYGNQPVYYNNQMPQMVPTMNNNMYSSQPMPSYVQQQVHTAPANGYVQASDSGSTRAPRIR